MNNSRMTAKERGLVKGAIRRVFSRSDLRRRVLDTTRIEHTEPSRPRVKKWSKCALCSLPTPTYMIEVDHLNPVVPTSTTLEEMSWDILIDRIWCDESLLQGICKPCHLEKTKRERKERKNGKTSRSKAVKSTGEKRSKRTTTRSIKLRTRNRTL